MNEWMNERIWISKYSLDIIVLRRNSYFVGTVGTDENLGDVDVQLFLQAKYAGTWIYQIIPPNSNLILKVLNIADQKARLLFLHML